MFALMLACSSISLDSVAAPEREEETAVAGIVTGSACDRACETLWTPDPECAQMFGYYDDAGSTIMDCKSDCSRADVYADALHADVDVYWSDGIEAYLVGYDCLQAVQAFGRTPCDHNEPYCNPAG